VYTVEEYFQAIGDMRPPVSLAGKVAVDLSSQGREPFMSELSFAQLTAPETKRNAISFYSRLRSQTPIEITGHPLGLKIWLVVDHDDAYAILRDPRFAKEISRVLSAELVEKTIPNIDLYQSLEKHMLNRDLSDHTRLRRLVSKAFTPRMIEQQRSHIQEITDELLDRVEEAGKMEFIKDFAYLLPVIVISDMLGIPRTDREKFRHWSDILVNNQSFFQTLIEQKDALTEFVEYMRGLIVQKRTNPADDLLSGLIQVEEEGDRFTERELTSMISLLIIAGHETTTNLIGTGVLTLLEHPDQLQMLREKPELLPGAIEELLRYTAPVIQTTQRWASEDLDLHGTQIKRGEMVLISLLAADLDPRHFPDPEQLNITREENAHLAFGKGIHYCLGAPLARLEGQIAIGTLLRRFSNLRLAVRPEDLEWGPSTIMRGLRALPLIFSR
jgi:cytochrome P450